MNARIRWVGDAMFVAESGSGHTIVVDGPPEKGGKNLGIRPMELMLLGLGSCTSFDVVDILKTGREAVTDCVTQLTAERADGVPAVFTRIHVHFVVSGRGLSDAKVARAIELSAQKYCSASIMLERAGVVISHDHEIVDVDHR